MPAHKLILAICFTAFLISACKKSKNDDSSPAAKYNVKTMDYVDPFKNGYHYRFVYNSKNDVDSIIRTGIGGNILLPVNVQKFTYTDSSCKITSVFSDSSSLGHDTYLAYNPDGAVTKKIDLLGTISLGAVFYTYNDKELTTAFYTGAVPIIYTYEWANGDIEKCLKDSLLLYTYFYDTSKRTLIDFQPFPDDYMQYGKPGYNTKHLLTQMKQGSDDFYYYYNFDPMGRPMTRTIVRKTKYGTTDTTVYIYGY